MKKIFIKLLLLFFICIIWCSCSYDRGGYSCDEIQRNKVVNFLKESIKDVNNIKNEKIKDVIKQLEISAIKSYCTQVVLRERKRCVIDQDFYTIEKDKTYYLDSWYCF